MNLNASAKLCILWYMVLLAYFVLCLWRKYRFQQRPFLLSPWVFIPLTTLLSVLLTSVLSFTLLPLAIEIAFGVLISFIHPIFGASFYLSTFIIKPWELLPETPLMTILPRSLAALAFGALAVHFANKRNSKIFFNLGVGLFFGFFGWTFISALTAYNSNVAVEAYTNTLIPVIATFLLIINASQDKLDLEVIRGSLIIAILTLTSIAIVRTLWGWLSDFSQPIPRLEGEGQWANANDIAALMVLALPLVVYPFILRGGSLWNRVFGIALSFFLLFGIWLSQSRGAVLAIAIGFAISFLVAKKLSVKTLIPLILLLLLPVIFLSTLKRESDDLEGSNTMRLEYTLVGFRMLKANPITGVGYDNYSSLFERYTTKFEEYGKRTAHSSWILAMAETGLPGLFLFVSLFVFVLNKAYKLRVQQPEFLTAIVSYGICMSLLSHTYQSAPFVLFAWILSAGRIYKIQNT